MQKYKELLDLFNKALLKEKEAILNRVPKGLYDPVIYTLEMGGKRLRPVLMLMAYSLFDDQLDEAIPAAIALEVFHNFTLLHDDIMDNADIRRGKPSVHKAYSENTAILSGDAMSILSYEYIMKTKSGDFRKIVELYTQTALEICEGQQYDMDFETRDDVKVDEYLEMIRLKTAVLLACSLKMGALVANQSYEIADSLYQVGINMGMAFQLRDDLLDTFGNEEKFGKAIGGDIASNKKTYLLLKAMELANDDQKSELKYWLSQTTFDRNEKVDAVKQVFNELNIQDEVNRKIESYYKETIRLMDEYAIKSEYYDDLLLLAKKLMQRLS